MVLENIELLDSPFGDITLKTSSHSVKESSITLLLGQGFSKSMDEDLLKYVSNTLAEEAITVIRFDYPNLKKKPKGFPLVRKFLPIYKYVFDHVSKQPEYQKSKIFIGGKSLSARVASHIRSEKVLGYVFLGFPLHLETIPISFPKRQFINFNKSMIFIQGSEDPYASRSKVEELVKNLNPLAYMMMIPEANHSLRLKNEEKRTQVEVDKEISDIILWYIGETFEKQNKN